MGNKKRVLCFGDSNTWGHIPGDGGRYEEEERYPGILQNELGDTYRIIEEGLCGRTTVFSDLIEAERCGIEHLFPILSSHAPLDGLVLMLGTNDTKIRFNVNAEVISLGMQEILFKTQNILRNSGQKTKIILVAPVPLGPVNDAMFDQESVIKSQGLASFYQELAEKHGCRFLNGAEVVKKVGCDGIHLDKDGHKQLGKALAKVIKDYI